MSPRSAGRDDPGEDDAIGPGAGQPAEPTPDRIVDPRAVRVALGASAWHAEVPPVVIEPPAAPLLAGADDEVVIVDGEPRQLRLEPYDSVHAVLVEGHADPIRTPVLLLPDDGPAGPRGRRQVVVDGWLVEVEVGSERHASLRERARRGREAASHGGPTEVRAIIPGQVVSVSVVAGDEVLAGQQLLVVEAMKMQNELRAPRDGVISRVAVGAGQTIDVGDIMLVIG